MSSGVPLLEDPAATRRQLESFLASYVEGAGAEGVVVGLSGGVDSAVCAALAARALGAGRVLGLLMPHAASSPEDEAHGRLVAEHLGVRAERVEITPIVDAVRSVAAVPLEGACLNNAKARARMVTLYAHANAMNRLVVGTGNKSELLTGYFTKYGDGGADVYPIGDLYKAQVWQLARELGLPGDVVEKAPSAGLYPGQTDEAELGFTYADLDRVLAAFEGGRSVEEASRATGVAGDVVERILERVRVSEHKRSPLVIPKVGFRTPGLDWRLPRQPRALEAPGGGA